MCHFKCHFSFRDLAIATRKIQTRFFLGCLASSYDLFIIASLLRLSLSDRAPGVICQIKDVIRPPATAAVAVTQINPLPHSFPYYPAPYHPSILEQKFGSFNPSPRRFSPQNGPHTSRSHPDYRGIPCTEAQGDSRSPAGNHMSQEPSAPHLPQTSHPNNKQSTGSSGDSRTLPPIKAQNDGTTSSPSPAAGPPHLPENTGNSTPATSSVHTQPPFKAIGMQNILNPPNRDKVHGYGGTEQVDVPSSSSTNTPYMSATSLSQSPSNKSLPSITPPTSVAYPSLAHPGPRHILNPRAPSLYSASNITRSVPNGTIDAKRSPFVTSVDRRAVSGPVSIMLPEVPGGLTLGFNPDVTGQQAPRSPPIRRMSGIAPQPGPMRERRLSGSGGPHPQSARSDSPSTSYSSYSRFSRTPPIPPSNVPTGQPTSYFASYNTSGPTTTFRMKEQYGAGNNGPGASSYPSMALDTDQGTIPVPVDILAASKVADEKRRRNATASHRFRQRRKEKERETSQNIAKLEHQIREIAEEREFYRMERDYFRNIACSGSNALQISPRPPSPRQVRLAQLGSSSSYGSSQWQGQEDPNATGRNTRRRTSNYTPTTAMVPQAMTQSAHTPFPQRPSLHPEHSEQRTRIAPGQSSPSHPSVSHGPHGQNPPSAYNKDWRGSQGPSKM